MKGAAEATVLAQAAAGLGIALYALVKEPELNMKKMKEEGIGIRADLLKEIFSYSASTGIQQSVMNFGILMVQGLVNSFGTSVMAAFAAGVKIDTLAYMPAQEFGNAYSIFISQNYGADKKERIRKGTKSAAVTVIMFCAAASAAVFFGAEFLMGIFIDPQKTQIIQIGTGYLKTEGACYCGIGILFCSTDISGQWKDRKFLFFLRSSHLEHGLSLPMHVRRCSALERSGRRYRSAGRWRMRQESSC